MPFLGEVQMIAEYLIQGMIGDCFAYGEHG